LKEVQHGTHFLDRVWSSRRPLVASLLMNRGGEGILGDILLGLIGSVVGGFIAQWIGWPGVYTFNPWSFIVAVGGAVIVLAIYHALVQRQWARL
jgi:uncharacterized membrane protein YeaQ/YmgE (transglycosylase-associated protein family)